VDNDDDEQVLFFFTCGHDRLLHRMMFFIVCGTIHVKNTVQQHDTAISHLLQILLLLPHAGSDVSSQQLIPLQ